MITTARKGSISENDMAGQLAAIDFQSQELFVKRDETIAAIAVQQQGDQLRDWVDKYLSYVADGLKVFENDISEMDEQERACLYQTFDAARFDKKFKGDKMAALRWAILEEKRRIVRMLIDQVFLKKDENGEKKIIPQLAFDVPIEFASLVYDDQSLAYIEQARDLVGDD
ncbi:MAG TPA: hypothetical protein VLA72_12570 [Anaerolineales bacterium]|nr:hypothetical protein [Anaerolineales bacterium]